MSFLMTFIQYILPSLLVVILPPVFKQLNKHPMPIFDTGFNKKWRTYTYLKKEYGIAHPLAKNAKYSAIYGDENLNEKQINTLENFMKNKLSAALLKEYLRLKKTIYLNEDTGNIEYTYSWLQKGGYKALLIWAAYSTLSLLFITLIIWLYLKLVMSQMLTPTPDFIKLAYGTIIFILITFFCMYLMSRPCLRIIPSALFIKKYRKLDPRLRSVIITKY